MRSRPFLLALLALAACGGDPPSDGADGGDSCGAPPCGVDGGAGEDGGREECADGGCALPCPEGPITETCLCGETVSDEGYCCDGAHRTSIGCEPVPACAEGEVSSPCECGGYVADSGYCCSDLHQSASCSAETYYVSSSTGSDSNPGTSPDAPWRTLSKVDGASLSAGSAVLFARGDAWSGTVTVSASGTSEAPIVFGAYGAGADPKLYGSEVISGWTVHAGSIYEADVAEPVSQLFVDGERIRPARSPNEGYFFITSVESPTRFTSTDLDGSIDYAGAVWFGRTGVYFTPTHGVVSSSSQTLTLDAAPQKDLGVHEGFFLMNELELLDQAGEWFYDASTSTVYLWTPDGSSPATHEVRGSVHADGFLIAGREHVVVADLDILHHGETGIRSPDSDYVTIRNNDILYPDAYGIHDDSGTNYMVSGNVVRGANHHGIHLRTTHSTVVDNQILDTAMFDDLGLTGAGRYYYGTAAYVVGGNNTVRYNRIIGAGYNGIFFSAGDNLIEHNFIQDTCLLKGDGGGIYTTQTTTSTAGSVVNGNIVINVVGEPYGYRLPSGDQSRAFGEGIYIDESAEGVTVTNNTVARCSNSGIYLHDNAGAEVSHNTVLDARQGIQAVRDHGSNSVHQNLVYVLDEDDYEPNQLLVRRYSSNTTFDRNTYYSPYNTEVFRNSGPYYTFSGWQSATGQDASSTIDTTPLGAGETPELFYNDTKATRSITLTGSYRDLDGSSVSSPLVLAPFTSRILIRE